jgi:peroxiredoxin
MVEGIVSRMSGTDMPSAAWATAPGGFTPPCFPSHTPPNLQNSQRKEGATEEKQISLPTT